MIAKGNTTLLSEHSCSGFSQERKEGKHERLVLGHCMHDVTKQVVVSASYCRPTKDQELRKAAVGPMRCGDMVVVRGWCLKLDATSPHRTSLLLYTPSFILVTLRQSSRCRTPLSRPTDSVDVSDRASRSPVAMPGLLCPFNITNPLGQQWYEVHRPPASRVESIRGAFGYGNHGFVSILCLRVRLVRLEFQQK